MLHDIIMDLSLFAYGLPYGPSAHQMSITGDSKRTWEVHLAGHLSLVFHYFYSQRALILHRHCSEPKIKMKIFQKLL